MAKFLIFIVLLALSSNAQADSVILMIGDGMGHQHISCVGERHTLFLETLIPRQFIRTASADNPVTDSAASATAYACGIKTNNGYLGMNPREEKCVTIAEEAAQQGKEVYIISSDNDTGATPSAFYAHVNQRYKADIIAKYRDEAAEYMHISLNVPSTPEAVEALLDELQNQQKQYFVMIEEAYIDKCSHENDFDCMEKALVDFDKAVQMAYEFAEKRADVHLFVTADHETGGLTQKCRYMTHNHTLLDVPLYALTSLPIHSGETVENTVLYEMMQQALSR